MKIPAGRKRDSEGTEEVVGKAEPGRAGPAAAPGAVPGLTVPSRGTRHWDSTWTCWETPSPPSPPPTQPPDPAGGPQGSGTAKGRARHPLSSPQPVQMGDPGHVPTSSVLTWNDNVSQTQHGKVVGLQSLLQQVLRENHYEEQREEQ